MIKYPSAEQVALEVEFFFLVSLEGVKECNGRMEIRAVERYYRSRIGVKQG